MGQQVVIITGAGNGIGRETAKLLATQDKALVLVDFDEKSGQDTLHAVKEHQQQAIFVHADVSKSQDVKKYVEAAKEAFGRIDAFINNAGVLSPPSLLADLEEETFDNVISVNLKGTFLGLKYVLKEMEQQQSGVIVNTSSAAGIQGQPYLGGYAASKHGVIGLTRTAAIEYGPSGIRVNAICPGGVMTNMTKGLTSSPEENGPLRRLADASEIANVIAFLISEEASYVNGAVVPIDGGLTS
ncbi:MULTISPECIES: SDR family NAD(P)-dependent oxidoreductase [Lysinibacillus]|jgi:NAD(P)-dependent dehydrogenase (short-subunit alcohol dehydrogenase family)|uniref:SDR family NAD(P)-dependent oxidoreductase n=1 Tax=Lysinibacillus TaxID=400634 RepID=UPI000A71695F|nr:MULTISPECIES: SDR family oxidoreductase [Lysinibacillus]WCH46647.1 SDR family oxidoreductase [Lysinibacillus sp. OF-1]